MPCTSGVGWKPSTPTETHPVRAPHFQGIGQGHSTVAQLTRESVVCNRQTGACFSPHSSRQPMGPCPSRCLQAAHTHRSHLGTSRDCNFLADYRLESTGSQSPGRFAWTHQKYCRHWQVKVNDQSNLPYNLQWQVHSDSNII